MSTHKGLPALTLAVAQTEATFLPSLGMLGVSLKHEGEELLQLPGGIAGWRKGQVTGLPIMAPWANRIDGKAYQFGKTKVNLTKAPGIRLDANGLPIHGTLAAHAGWDIERIEAGSGSASLVARLSFEQHRELLASFPFPHDLEIEAQVSPGVLRVETRVRPTGERDVPVCFGWHPYFTLPTGGRAGWKLGLPKRERLVTDRRLIPTGERVREEAEDEALTDRFFDTGYAVGAGASFSLSGGRWRIAMDFGEGYRFAQIYAPPPKPFVCIEPMTAPTNALQTGECPRVAPGKVYRAAFSIRITR